MCDADGHDDYTITGQKVEDGVTYNIHTCACGENSFDTSVK